MKKQPLWTKDFLSISITNAFLFMSFYVLLTTLPIYVLDELDGNEQQVGLIVTIFLFAAVLCRPLTGKWMDDIGRKKILIISISMFCFVSILYFWSTNFFILLLLRFLHGVSFGMATTATGAIAADVVPSERRGEGLGYYAMFQNLAMVIGPFTGLTIIQYTGFFWIFGLCTVLALTASFLSGVINPPVLSSKGAAVAETKMLSLSGFFEKTAIPVAITAAILSFAYSSILSFISVYAKDLGLVEAASYFFVVYAASILISRPFTGKWFDQYGENRIIYPAIALFAIGLLVLSQASTTFLFLLAGAIIGLGYGTLVPSLQTLAIKNSPKGKSGLATATFFTLFDIGIGLGSYLMGILAAYTGFRNLYLVTVGISIIGFLMYYFLHGKKQAGALFLKQRNLL